MSDERNQIRSLSAGRECKVDDAFLEQIIRVLDNSDVGRQPAEAIAAAVKDKFGFGGIADADELANYVGGLVGLLRVARKSAESN